MTRSNKNADISHVDFSRFRGQCDLIGGSPGFYLVNGPSIRMGYDPWSRSASGQPTLPR